MSPGLFGILNVSELARGAEFVVLQGSDAPGVVYKVPHGFVDIERCTSLYARVAERLRYRKLVRLLRRVSKAPPELRATLLEFHVRRNIQLLLQERSPAPRIRGPLIEQARAEVFFDNEALLTDRDWSGLARAQHVMWTFGIGLSAPAEVWGPKNWAIGQNGDLVLGDLGYLTTNRHLVMSRLTPDASERRLHKLLARFPSAYHQKIVNYFERQRLWLNIQEFERLWRSDAEALQYFGTS